MKNSSFIGLVACTISALSLCGCGSSGSDSVEDWPSRPISISCFAAAGGGTDLISRLVAKEMESLLGAKINVVNRTAGRGAAAVNYVSQSKRDGNNWGGFSESLLPGARARHYRNHFEGLGILHGRRRSRRPVSPG